MQERIQPFIVYEDSFSLEEAAEKLGCQQKKIMAEWANGNIKMVLDFGPEENVNPDLWDKYDRHYRDISPWCLADVSAPATEAFFPNELLTPLLTPSFLNPSCLEEDNPTFFQSYGQSGFYYSSENSKAEKQPSKDGASDVMRAIGVLLFGYWVVSYREFLRLHIQSSFTLKPLTDDPNELTVAATFIPGEGSRRVNAPDKKNLRITATGIETMKGLIAKQNKRQQPLPIEAATQEFHGNVERFAIERERVLAAALYVARHYKSEVGKTFKSHAQCIHDYRFLFWPDDKSTPEPERLAKILADAARRPEEWKILGGKQKEK